MMTLANGRPYLAIPGPSVMPDAVLAAMQRPAPNIYAGEIVETSASLWPDLRNLAGTSHHVAGYISNGHGIWEAASANIFSRGERALVLATGHFGRAWAGAMRAVGVEAEVMDFGASPLDLDRVAARLRADCGQSIKAVMVCHTDTASGVRSDLAALRGVMDGAGHGALLVADCIASLGCDMFKMDEWGVDVTLSASQKGLMTPPGLGFIWFSPRARAKGAASNLRTPYWDWTTRADGAEFWRYWGGTPPTHHIYALRAALDMILAEGLPAIWARHAALAAAVWAAFDRWGAGNLAIALNVARPEDRSHAVTAAALGAHHAASLRAWCEAKGGVTLGVGLGMASPADPEASGYLRLGHMGHVNAHMVLGALAVMQAGMEAIGIAHDRGGLAAAAAVIAERA